LLGVRLPDGRWVGKGGWRTDIGCVGYAVEVVEKGPVRARVKMRYDFEEGRSWQATVDLVDEQDLAVIEEVFDLGENKPIPMEGLDGMKPGEKYAYVRPKFEPAEKALTWD